jgi:hypothetical protein
VQLIVTAGKARLGQEAGKGVGYSEGNGRWQAAGQNGTPTAKLREEKPGNGAVIAPGFES